MNESTPAHIIATLACAVLALLAAYLFIMLLAGRAIDALNGITHRERRARTRHVYYQARCSTAPDVSHHELAAIVGTVVALGVIALLSFTWLGQELVEYLARAIAAKVN
ncbi:hypothetical protein [Massilia sp. DWR3-1-1]|uniref:hypothetical protein n=1 Tax=Massilia sp. DWR3-1-1 TaxID=2804559 RepID=UPI003CFB6CE9